MITRAIRSVLIASAIAVTGAAQADSVKIGFVTTLTTPAAVIGEDMKNSVELALEHIGNKMGPLDVELIFEDDGFKPDIGKQKTDKLVKQDDVDFVAGYHLVARAAGLGQVGARCRQVPDQRQRGPSQIAGKRCHENFFSSSWQNDQTPMALGEHLNQKGVKSIYVMAPNYAAGKDMVRGVESTFKGNVLGKDMTKWGADAQLDFLRRAGQGQVLGRGSDLRVLPGQGRRCFHQAIPAGRPAGHDGSLLGVHRRFDRAAQAAGGRIVGRTGFEEYPAMVARYSECRQPAFRR